MLLRKGGVGSFRLGAYYDLLPRGWDMCCGEEGEYDSGGG